MKDETAGVSIKKFVGLKQTMYSVLLDDSSEHKETKRVNRNYVEKKLIINIKTKCKIKNF